MCATDCMSPVKSVQSYALEAHTNGRVQQHTAEYETNQLGSKAATGRLSVCLYHPTRVLVPLTMPSELKSHMQWDALIHKVCCPLQSISVLGLDSREPMRTSRPFELLVFPSQSQKRIKLTQLSGWLRSQVVYRTASCNTTLQCPDKYCKYD